MIRDMRSDDYEREIEKKVWDIDKKILHLLWTIFLSMITAIITTLLLCTK